MVAKSKSSGHPHSMVKKARKPSSGTSNKRGGGNARAPFKKSAKRSGAEGGEKKSSMRKSAPRRAGGEGAAHKTSAGARTKHAPGMMGSTGAPGAAPATMGAAAPAQGSPMRKKGVKRSMGGSAVGGKSPSKRTMRKKGAAGGAKKTSRKNVKKQ